MTGLCARRAGSEYWIQRCTRCGGIQPDIVKEKARQGMIRKSAQRFCAKIMPH
jgi:hypothetical protein